MLTSPRRLQRSPVSWRHAACWAVLAGASAAASAQTLDYSLALTDGVVPDYHFDDGMPCNIHTERGETRYRTLQMQVTTAGDYRFLDAKADVAYDGYPDGSLGIYGGPFNPASPATHCVASLDDDQTYTLPAGVYTLVLASQNDMAEIPGNYRYTISGPAAVVLRASGSDATKSVPSLGGWGLAMLTGMAALLGGRRLRQRKP